MFKNLRIKNSIKIKNFELKITQHGFIKFTKKSEAAWFDDNWIYRRGVNYVV